MLRLGRPPERAVCSAARWPRRQLRNPTWSWRRIKRLKALERENATLKRLLADADLEKVALTKIANGISGRHATRRACHDPDATLPSARRHFGPAYHTRAEDPAVNHEKMQRLWREQGLRAPRRRRRSGHHSDRRTRNALVRRGPFTDSGHATGRSRTDPYRLSPLGWPGHHRVPESVFHDVPTAAASSTGSEAGVARHRNTVEHSVCLRCDRA